MQRSSCAIAELGRDLVRFRCLSGASHASGRPPIPKPVCGFCGAMEKGSGSAMEEDMMRQTESERKVAWSTYQASLQANKENQEKFALATNPTMIDAARGEAYFRGWEDGQSMLMEQAFWDNDGYDTEQEQQWKRRRTTHKWWWRGYCFAKMKYAHVAPSAVMTDQSAGGWEEESSRCFEAWELLGASLQAWEEWDERVDEELQQRDGDSESAGTSDEPCVDARAALATSQGSSASSQGS